MILEHLSKYVLNIRYEIQMCEPIDTFSFNE